MKYRDKTKKSKCQLVQVNQFNLEKNKQNLNNNLLNNS